MKCKDCKWDEVALKTKDFMLSIALCHRCINCHPQGKAWGFVPAQPFMITATGREVGKVE